MAGATGLVGRRLLERLGADAGVGAILVPARRTLDGPVPANARPVVVDFTRLEDHPELFAVDQLFVCLGTTIRVAGSQAAFRAVDFDLIVEFARRALNAGAEDCLLISSLGADPRSRVFYSRVKGETEQAVRALPWRTLAILRPSILLGDRREKRPGEGLGVFAARLLSPLLRGPLARYHPVRGDEVAEAMARLARSPAPGTRVYESEEIRALAR